MRKTVSRDCDQVQHKSDCTTKEDCYRFEIIDLGLYYVAKIRVLISCAVTMQVFS